MLCGNRTKSNFIYELKTGTPGDILLFKKMLSSGVRSDTIQLHHINYEYTAVYPTTYIEFQMNDVSVGEGYIQ